MRFHPAVHRARSRVREYKDKGLAILGFPCNQFGSQEPGSNEEIKLFCSTKYNVTFPLFDKIDVNGPQRHPLYMALAAVIRHSPATSNGIHQVPHRPRRHHPQAVSVANTPNSPEVTTAIEAALAAK